MSAYSNVSLLVLTRFFIIVALLLSGFRHIMQPYYFTQAVASYEILPLPLVSLASIGVASFQIALGIGMLAGFLRHVEYVVSFAIFAMFTAAQAFVLFQGKSNDCGCFGFTGTKISIVSILVPLSLMVGSFILLYAKRIQVRVISS